MAAIYSNGVNRWNILDFNFTKRDALSSVYKQQDIYGLMPVLPLFIPPEKFSSNLCSRSQNLF
jgi:hypothetical protein